MIKKKINKAPAKDKTGALSLDVYQTKRHLFGVGYVIFIIKLL